MHIPLGNHPCSTPVQLLSPVAYTVCALHEWFALLCATALFQSYILHRAINSWTTMRRVVQRGAKTLRLCNPERATHTLSLLPCCTFLFIAHCACRYWQTMTWDTLQHRTQVRPVLKTIVYCCCHYGRSDAGGEKVAAIKFITAFFSH